MSRFTVPTVPLAWTRALVILATAALVIGLLHWLRPILIPLALAALGTFLLSPLVLLAERHRVPRALATGLVVAATTAVFAALLTFMGSQLSGLVGSFPQYEDRVTARLLALRDLQPQIIDRLGELVERIREQMGDNAADDRRPATVRVVPDTRGSGWMTMWQVLAPVLAPFATLGLTLVLLMFMLLRREDLRDRLISLMGRRNLTATTRTLEDAGNRISRYLLIQLAINTAFGVGCGVGFALLGLPYAALFGLIAGVLRYVPYVGAWVGALLPLGFSLVVFDGWSPAISVLALVLVLDLIANVLVEPYCYGKGIGISAAATLVMVTFWTWLWGPVGIILATPLTACLVALARQVPELSALETLLGDSPVLEAPVRIYQRLLARDIDEATAIAEQALSEHSLVEVFDQLLIPALVAAGRDHHSGALSNTERDEIFAAVQSLAETLATFASAPGGQVASVQSSVHSTARVLVLPTRDRKDMAAARMVSILLERLGLDVHGPNSVPLAGELSKLASAAETSLACVVALPPGGIAAARLFCLRLRAQGVQAIVYAAAALEAEEVRAQLRASGADQLAESMATLVSIVASIAPGSASPSTAALPADTRRSA